MPSQPVSCLTRLSTRFGRTKAENCGRRQALAKASKTRTTPVYAMFPTLHAASNDPLPTEERESELTWSLVLAYTDERQHAHFAEDARKTRLQLVRARKDLGELWQERDELAMLAGQAIQVRDLYQYICAVVTLSFGCPRKCVQCGNLWSRATETF